MRVRVRACACVCVCVRSPVRVGTIMVHMSLLRAFLALLVMLPF